MKQSTLADKGKASSSSSSNSIAEKTTELAAELTEVVLQLQQYKARNADVSGACLWNLKVVCPAAAAVQGEER